MTSIQGAAAAFLAAGVLALSGCQNAGLAQDDRGPKGSQKRSQSTQRYEVLAPAREVNADEAIGFIRAQDELYQTSEFTEGAEYLNGPNNHPAYIGEGGEALTAITIRKGETLLSVANRVMDVSNFSRLIYDLSSDAPSPDSIQSDRVVRTLGGPTLFGEIASVYQDDVPGVQLYAAQDGQAHALVISDKRYPRWSRLAIYDVIQGTLKENVDHLSNMIGWKLHPRRGWEADDFHIYAGYPIVIQPENPRASVETLLDRYPVQAHLNQNTHQVTIIRRPQPNVR